MQQMINRTCIAPPPRPLTNSTGLRRVAAYCRVSTDMDRQRSSLQAQVEVFRQRIDEHPGWVLVEVYADEGLSATSTAKRAAFQRMMNDAENGKIDYIITKSISRFARNTLDCLTHIRRLQSIGVNLLFEKENLDTGSELSEMMLTVLAAFAQEESRSISENLKWGLRKGYESGHVRWQKLYGYRRGECGRGKTSDAPWLIEPTEAAVVREIFTQYERGLTSQQIAEGLNARGVPSPRGATAWRSTAILAMLGNEKYVGDVKAQKFISIDYLSHRTVRNSGAEIPFYYIREHHAGLVSRKTFDRVARIRAMRDNRKGGSMQYPYGCTELRCPRCGEQLVQRMMQTSGPRMIWACFGEGGCKGYAVKAWQLNEALLDAWQQARCDPPPETVEHWWLDEYVRRIEPALDNYVTVAWRDGGFTRVRLHIDVWQHEPTRQLQLYQAYIEKRGGAST